MWRLPTMGAQRLRRRGCSKHKKRFLCIECGKIPQKRGKKSGAVPKTSCNVKEASSCAHTEDKDTRHVTNEFSCIKCKQPDSDEMVQCDSCDKWIHFGCAGVDSSIKHKPFHCETCIAIKQSNRNKAGSAASKIQSRSSGASARAQLQLQKLDEELKIQQEYLNKKYEVLANASSGSRSSIKQADQLSEISKVQAWLTSNNNQQVENNKPANQQYETMPKIQDIPHLSAVRYNTIPQLHTDHTAGCQALP